MLWHSLLWHLLPLKNNNTKTLMHSSKARIIDKKKQEIFKCLSDDWNVPYMSVLLTFLHIQTWHTVKTRDDHPSRMRDSTDIGRFVPHSTRCMLRPAFQLCIPFIFITEIDTKIRNTLNTVTGISKKHLRSRHVLAVKITNRQRGVSADDDCMDGVNRMCGPHQVLENHRQEMVERTRKNTTFSFHLKKKSIAAFRHDFLLILIVHRGSFYGVILMTSVQSALLQCESATNVSAHKDSLHSHSKQMRSLSLSIRL